MQNHAVSHVKLRVARLHVFFDFIDAITGSQVSSGATYLTMPPRRPAASAWPRCLGIVADMAGLGMMAPLLPFHVDAHWVGPILTGQYMAVVVGQILFVTHIRLALGPRRAPPGTRAPRRRAVRVYIYINNYRAI